MNTLDNITLTSSAIQYPTISGGVITAVDSVSTSPHSSFHLTHGCLITIGSHVVSASDLAHKLDRLDELLRQHFPEDYL